MIEEWRETLPDSDISENDSIATTPKIGYPEGSTEYVSKCQHGNTHKISENSILGSKSPFLTPNSFYGPKSLENIANALSQLSADFNYEFDQEIKFMNAVSQDRANTEAKIKNLIKSLIFPQVKENLDQAIIVS